MNIRVNNVGLECGWDYCGLRGRKNSRCEQGQRHRGGDRPGGSRNPKLWECVQWRRAGPESRRQACFCAQPQCPRQWPCGDWIRCTGKMWAHTRCPKFPQQVATGRERQHGGGKPRLLGPRSSASILKTVESHWRHLSKTRSWGHHGGHAGVRR